MTRSKADSSGPSAGFTVLEVLVALALLAAALVPLLALQQSSGRAALAVERSISAGFLRRQALDYLKGVNFARFPEGQVSLSGVSVSWRAVPVSDWRSTLAFPTASQGRFQLRLYRVEVMWREGQSNRAGVAVEMLGWKPSSPARAQY